MPRRKKSPDVATGNRAVAYVRVSSEEQARTGISLDAQEARLRDYCRHAGLELVALVRDEGVSAGKPLASRPGGAELLRIAAEQGAAHVVALKLDRLFRSTRDALDHVNGWNRRGVALHLVDMGGQALNTASAIGQLFLTLLAALGEFERNITGERTAAVLAHKKAKGEAVGRPPRGLRIAEKRYAVADPAALELVRRAAAMRRRGATYQAIADALTPGTPPSTIYRWLSNPNLTRAADAAA